MLIPHFSVERLLWATALSLGAGVAAAAAADSPNSPDSPDAAESVIVSATRIPTPESELASSVTVITADQIAAQQERTLPDVLTQVPGLNLVQTGGVGGT